MLSTCLYASAGSPENKQKKLEILTEENMYLREIMTLFLEEQKQTTSDAKYFFIYQGSRRWEGWREGQ